MDQQSSSLSLVELTSESVPELFEIAVKAHSNPMSEKTIASCFGHLYYNIGLNKDNQLVGFAIVHHVFDETTLMDICISPEKQGLGLGKALMCEVIKAAKKRDAAILQLEVRASNSAAIALYRKKGFKEIGCRANYYPTENGREDAILMELRFLR